MRMIYLLVVLALVGWSAQPALGSCSGQLEGAPRAGGGEYDPFDAVDFRRRQIITVRNTGTEKCDFVVVFKRPSAQGRLSRWLKYSIEDLTAQSLLSEQTSPNSGTRYLFFANVVASQTSSAEFYFVMPRGQFAFPGHYHDNYVTLSLYTRTVSGAISPVEEDAKELQIDQPVKASVGITIAGGGLATTLGFGEFAKGMERSVVLQTTANYAYSLALRSANSSVMKLEPEIQGQSWTVPYSLQINSQSVSLRSPVKIKQSILKGTWGRENHTLAFRIEDVASRRAGLYRDVVSVEISVEP